MSLSDTSTHDQYENQTQDLWILTPLTQPLGLMLSVYLSMCLVYMFVSVVYLFMCLVCLYKYLVNLFTCLVYSVSSYTDHIA